MYRTIFENYYVTCKRCYNLQGRHKFNNGRDDKIKPNNMKKKVTVRTLSGECVGNFINTTSQLIMYSASVQ